ncbi:MAG: endonuclease, partial [Bacteroidaceae bacterium]|nr:endonuclease [Bacteroidaceae bacterium]
KALGSYKYQGIWEWIDQIWVSQTLAELSTSVHTLTSPFLLESDPVFGGTRPFRTFIGPSYHAGYSDHLPVVYRFPL